MSSKYVDNSWGVLPGSWRDLVQLSLHSAPRSRAAYGSVVGNLLMLDRGMLVANGRLDLHLAGGRSTTYTVVNVVDNLGQPNESILYSCQEGSECPDWWLIAKGYREYTQHSASM